MQSCVTWPPGSHPCVREKGAGRSGGCPLGSHSSSSCSSRRGRGGEGSLLDSEAQRPVPREEGYSVVNSSLQGSLEPPGQHLNAMHGLETQIARGAQGTRIRHRNRAYENRVLVRGLTFRVQ